ncbi:MAG: hypothetical protein AB7J46_06455 [Candidatus Altimarinota bacterium]
MENQLTQLLLERVGGQEEATPVAPSGLPAPTPNAKRKLPPAWKRYLNALSMQQAIANNWTPHPTLVNILNKK